jgi:16S rRNA (cytidine1402-2'-O)-methyltransferase
MGAEVMNETLGLKSGLYVTATPIGNLGDISARAIDILTRADVILCEDTRVSKKLLSHLSISTPLQSYHDHNGDRVRPGIITRIMAGAAIALISDAGTPLISDPGCKLVAAAHNEGLYVAAIPGPSAPIAALMIAGLPTNRVVYEGFLPTKTGARQKALGALRTIDATLVFFESPKRLAKSLKDMAEVLGGERGAAICRELTKIYEEARRGTLQSLADVFAAEKTPKGEIVIVVGPPDAGSRSNDTDLDAALRFALKSLSIKEAASAVAYLSGQPRKLLYKRALDIMGKT